MSRPSIIKRYEKNGIVSQELFKFILLSFHFTVLHSRGLDQIDKRIIRLCFYAGMMPSSEKLLLQNSRISKNAAIPQIKRSFKKNISKHL